jgi:hypothetical protein
MKEDTIGIVGLTAPNDELTALHLHVEIPIGEPGHRKGDTEPIRPDLFDIVWRVAIGRSLGDALQRRFETIEAEQQWAIEQR